MRRPHPAESLIGFRSSPRSRPVGRRRVERPRCGAARPRQALIVLRPHVPALVPAATTNEEQPASAHAAVRAPRVRARRTPARAPCHGARARRQPPPVPRQAPPTDHPSARKRETQAQDLFSPPPAAPPHPPEAREGQPPALRRRPQPEAPPQAQAAPRSRVARPTRPPRPAEAGADRRTRSARSSAAPRGRRRAPTAPARRSGRRFRRGRP
ncbi:MAG: hypothetical protein QOD43_1564, partial [Gaiellaceae bacterium]|nr:hypothetical protein [Gaiellaceae bacterium]